MAHIYVIRHGESVHNRQGIIQGPRIDSALSETGEAQAQALGDAFSATPLDAVYASPMQRARSTAAGLISDTGIPLQVVPELYEMDFGDLCGQPVQEAQPVMDDLWNLWMSGFVDRPLPGGESPMLVRHRVRAFAERLRGMDGSIGVVAHGRLNRVLLTELAGEPLTQMGAFPQSNASITHLEAGGHGVQVHRRNDISHYT